MHFHRAFLFLLFFLSESLNAQPARYCIPARFSQSPIFEETQIRKDTDVVYAYAYNPFSGSVEALTLNIYYPDPAVDTMTKKPFILLVHGGSFLGGNINTQEFLCAEYARRGFVSASINYRLGWNCSNPSDYCNYCVDDTSYLRVATYMAVQDIRSALRFVSGNALGWGADRDWFFVGGASAGSIASFHAALWTQAQASQFAPLAVGMVGLLDTSGNAFPVMYSIRGITDNCGAIAEDSNLVSQLTIPLISFNDEFDCLVPSDTGHIFNCGCSSFYRVYGSGYIHPRMQAAGSCTELNTTPGSYYHCSFPALTIVQRTSCFFKRAMCNVCKSDTNSNPLYIKPCDSLGAGVEFGIDNFSISIFPMPVNNILSVNFSEHARHGGTIKCLNYLGQEIFAQQYFYMTKKLEIDTSALPSGTYFLIFENSEQTPPLKMLVIHQ